MLYQNIGSTFFLFVTKHAFVRRTDRQNYDPQDRASIAASRGQTFLYNATSYIYLKRQRGTNNFLYISLSHTSVDYMCAPWV